MIDVIYTLMAMGFWLDGFESEKSPVENIIEAATWPIWVGAFISSHIRIWLEVE